ncbi:MAG: integrin alpha [Planctomycetes bacterium]|nr:integrin alpha [Planctomycetota bacterium]
MSLGARLSTLLLLATSGASTIERSFGDEAGPRTLASPPWDAFGRSVANLGDVDGDGVPDCAIGCPWDGDASRSASVSCFSGASGRPVWTVDAERNDERFAACLRSAGDVNGDGASDLLVSTNDERVELHSGVDGSLLGAVSCPRAFAAIEPPFASLGDVDGDARADFVIGNVVYSGATITPLRVLAGPRPSLELHVSIANVGDLDADGLDDVGFASPDLQGGWLSFASTRTSECLRVVRGWSWVVMARVQVGDGPIRQEAMTFREEIFGDWLTSAGDIDRDGIDDVLVGGGRRRTAERRAWVISGRDASPIGVFEQGSELRCAAGGVGDVDGDGCSDVAFEWPSGWTRELGFATGRALDRRRAIAQLPWDPDLVMECSSESLESAGDVDRDGSDDVLVGVNCSSELQRAGCVVLISGATGATIRRYDMAAALAQLTAK